MRMRRNWSWNQGKALSAIHINLRYHIHGHQVDTLFDGVFGVRLVVFGYLSIYVISALGVVVWKLRGRFGKNSARTDC